MQNFRNLGDIGGGGGIFLTKPPKGTSLPDFTRFEPSIVQIHSWVFAPGVCMKQKGHYKKSQRSYISRICGEFPTQPNSTKIGIRVGVADVINHTNFDNVRSREYKVTDGHILACSIGIACRLVMFNSVKLYVPDSFYHLYSCY